MFSKNLFFLVIIFIFFSTCFLLIAQDKPLTLKELCIESSDIIIGTPTNISYYEKENGKYIFTNIDISIGKSLKGNLNKNEIIRLKMYGGTINGITTFVVDYPNFSLKKESLFFLKEVQVPIQQLSGPQRVFAIVGLKQGKMDIINSNGKNIVIRDFALPLEIDAKGNSISLSIKNPVSVDNITNLINGFINN